MAVTIRQCAMLVGGLGTRLGALAATTPKPLLPIGDRPFLAWLMREFIRFGVEEFLLLTGHLSDRIEAQVQALAERLPRPVRIVTSEEPERAGTGGAVFHARDKLAERFLLCNGDSLFDFNLARLLADAAGDGPEAIGRIVLRRIEDASRYGVVELDGGRVAAFRERPPPGTAGMINAGVYVYDRRLLDDLTANCSLERDVMPRLAERGVLRGTVADGYFCDIGIPEDLARARAEMPRVLHRQALFLDRDGVINVDHGYVGSREQFEWMPGAREAVRAATDAGWHVFVVTNQSGIARGLFRRADAEAVNARVAELLGPFGTVRLCPHGEDEGCGCRKPGPGMVLAAAADLGVAPHECVVVGDIGADVAAARAAGARGVLVPAAGIRPAELTGVRVAGDLAEAVRMVTGQIPFAPLWPNEAGD
jgi:D-glycero-D-manno-heptose 1,7-bisphosphate phosphatase